MRVKCFCPQIYKWCFPSCPNFYLVGIFGFAFSSSLENNSMIPYGAKWIALICINVVWIEFLDIDNMNTERNEAKHLKIERETSANFPNRFGLSFGAFECCVGLAIYASVSNLCSSAKTLLCFAGKTEVFLTIIFIYRSSFPKQVIASTDSDFSVYINKYYNYF